MADSLVKPLEEVVVTRQMIQEWNAGRPVMEKTMEEWYADDVYLQVLEVLVIIAPDCPFPLELLERILVESLEASLDFQPREEAEKLTRDYFDFALCSLEEEELITFDRDQDTATVTAAKQAELRDELVRLPATPQAVARLGWSHFQPRVHLTGWINEYTLRRLKPSHADHRVMLAMMTPHVLHLAARPLKKSVVDEEVADLVPTLWELYGHGLVTEPVLHAYTEALLTHCKQWETPSISYPLQIVGKMLVIGWEDAPRLAGRLLDLIEPSMSEERNYWRADNIEDFRAYRQIIAGASIPPKMLKA